MYVILSTAERRVLFALWMMRRDGGRVAIGLDKKAYKYGFTPRVRKILMEVR